jgi:DNA-binding response OmpR family regulator
MRRMLVAAGADCYMVKPFSPAALVEAGAGLLA